MPQLEIHLAVAEASEPVTYRVDGDLKRPGAAIQEAKTLAEADGHGDPSLEEVRLAEPA